MTARIERLKARIEQECEQAPASFAGIPNETWIDDGGRYLPLEDTRPDFVKADDHPPRGGQEDA